MGRPGGDEGSDPVWDGLERTRTSAQTHALRPGGVWVGPTSGSLLDTRSQGGVAVQESSQREEQRAEFVHVFPCVPKECASVRINCSTRAGRAFWVLLPVDSQSLHTHSLRTFPSSSTQLYPPKLTPKPTVTSALRL